MSYNIMFRCGDENEKVFGCFDTVFGCDTSVGG